MRILYIHGAQSTRRSFSYLSEAIKTPHTKRFFEYDTNIPCAYNIGLCQEVVDKFQPDVIIGHSLGGIIAAYMVTDAKRVALASPFGGSLIANWLPMFSRLTRDMSTTSPIIRGLASLNMNPTRFIAIVANGLDGVGFDGVVSKASQMALEGVDYREYNLNHFEIMVDSEIAEVIDEFINK